MPARLSGVSANVGDELASGEEDQRQLGHADLAVTSTYLRGIDNTEIIHAVYERSVPMIPASPRVMPDRYATPAIAFVVNRSAGRVSPSSPKGS